MALGQGLSAELQNRRDVQRTVGGDRTAACQYASNYLHVVDIRDRARVGNNTNCLKITVHIRSAMACIARHTDKGKNVLEENRKDKTGALHFTPKNMANQLRKAG